MEKENFSVIENSPSQFPKLFKVKDFAALDDIRFVGDSREVDMGQIVPVSHDNYATIFSYGANPCISGLIVDQNNQLFCLHSLGPILTSEQEDLIKSAKKGIIGGGIETLNSYKDSFKKSNIQIIIPPSHNHDFNFVLVKSKTEFKTKPGFYFCYDNQVDLD